jgi:hypothetical protein
MLIFAALLLLTTGFAGGYWVREFVSRRRRAAVKRRYLERIAARVPSKVPPKPTIVRPSGRSMKDLPLSIRNALRTEE